MISILTGLHVLICFGLIIVVLLQTGRGSGMASVFGGGGGGSVMGGKGFGGVLAKATAGLAIAFMVMSIMLSLIPRGSSQSSVLDDIERAPGAEAPAGGGVPGEMPTGVPTEGQPADAPAEAPTEAPPGG
jgi:preprotein translocase subunit SecG